MPDVVSVCKINCRKTIIHYTVYSYEIGTFHIGARIHGIGLDKALSNIGNLVSKGLFLSYIKNNEAVWSTN